jgi:two-component system, OmpR family, response regulator ResD
MNGWDVCKRIRSKSQIPILMLTARGDIHDKAESDTTSR